jgi:hypothetical protein
LVFVEPVPHNPYEVVQEVAPPWSSLNACRTTRMKSFRRWRPLTFAVRFFSPYWVFCDAGAARSQAQAWGWAVGCARNASPICEQPPLPIFRSWPCMNFRLRRIFGAGRRASRPRHLALCLKSARTLAAEVTTERAAVPDLNSTPSSNMPR